MKLTLIDPRYLKDSIGIISELVNDIDLRISKDKVEIVAMDPANVAMVIYKLLGSAFSEYEVDEEVVLGVNLSHLNQILKRAKPRDMLTLELDDEKNRLNVFLRGATNRSFVLSLLDTENKEQRVPNLKYDVNVETNNLLFNEAIEDMDVVADSLSLSLVGDKFVIEAEGHLNSAKVEITTDEETDIVNSSGDDVSSRYSIEYLKKIIKGSKLSNTVMLKFGQDYPLTIEYKVMDKLSLTFILDPRRVNVD
jgi:proliferating cell nuclear antigen